MEIHKRHQGSITTGTTPSSRRLLRATAWAGIVGPVAFTVSFLAQEQFRRGEYSPLAEQISALEAGPNGWIQQVTFVVFGVLTMAQAAGLHRAIAPSRAGFAGPAFLFLTGVGAVVAGVFPLREDAAGATYDPGGHLPGGMLFFLGSPVAFLLLSVRLRRDPSWRLLAPYAVASGVALLGGALMMRALVIPDHAPLHDWAGLAQRMIVLVLIFPMRVALGVRQLRLVAPSRPPGDSAGRASPSVTRR
jgi:hypothetical membrane protein